MLPFLHLHVSMRSAVPSTRPHPDGVQPAPVRCSLDLALSNLFRPSRSLHFKAIGELRVPLRPMHRPDETECRCVEGGFFRINDILVSNMRLNDISNDQDLIVAQWHFAVDAAL